MLVLSFILLSRNPASWIPLGCSSFRAVPAAEAAEQNKLVVAAVARCGPKNKIAKRLPFPVKIMELTFSPLQEGLAARGAPMAEQGTSAGAQPQPVLDPCLHSFPATSPSTNTSTPLTAVQMMVLHLL